MENSQLKHYYYDNMQAWPTLSGYTKTSIAYCRRYHNHPFAEPLFPSRALCKAKLLRLYIMLLADAKPRLWLEWICEVRSV